MNNELTSIRNFCKKLHRSIVREFNQRVPLNFFIVSRTCSLIACVYFFSALVWGCSVKRQPQKVTIDRIPNDEDVVQVIKKSKNLNTLLIVIVNKSSDIISRLVERKKILVFVE